MLSIDIFSIIVYKFSYWQKTFLGILFEIDKNSKICFYYTTLTLYLSIGLLIKSSKKLVFHNEKIAKQKLEL